MSSRNVSLMIEEELHRMEQTEGIRLLYACESGSRAWGFPSKDSDYDVRFIYIRPVEWYLSIFDKRDVIEQPISNRLDINGWDLRKCLTLYRKSNPPLLEWLQSPIVYQEKYSIAAQIREVSSQIFSPRACIYHYLHMATGNYRDYLQGEQVKIKKYFYVLRPILACAWIERYHTMPPIEFHQLVEAFVPAGSELRAVIDDLLTRKMAGDELDYEPKVHVINDYLDERIAYFEAAALHMNAAQGGLDQQLDELFRSALEEVWAGGI